MTISRSSTLSVNVMLIFDLHDLNCALFLDAATFSALSFLFAAVKK